MNKNRKPPHPTTPPASTKPAPVPPSGSSGPDDQRPARTLSARQIVASTLLGADPPQLPGRHLVRAGALFGVSEGATRVALSRMVAAGELRHQGDRYTLTEQWQARRARQAEGRRPTLRDWSGDWLHFVVVAEARRPDERSRLRDAMRTLHLAELREGVWLRPDNLDPARLPAAMATVWDQCLTLWSRLGDRDGGVDMASRNLAQRLWPLDRWAGTAVAFVDVMELRRPDLERHDPSGLPEAWELSAAVLRHLLADPLLPPTLLPADWPGDRLRSTYDGFDAAFKECWRVCIDRH
jgi:phenylacetic acid degradation operon negative regulatory protein